MNILKLRYLLFFLLLTQGLNAQIRTGAECMNEYVPHLKGKRVGLVANHTSTVGSTHLLDTLLSLQVKVATVFSPEHGFRGNADAGEHVKNNTDVKTGVPIISLYGANRKPTAEQFKTIDVIVFDIQDVGVRFYTYISTMHYVLETCAETGTPCIILDRPNPNGFYVDGPVLNPSVISSFIGMHPVPIVHGCTVGEYARMIVGEGWLAGGAQPKVQVITCKNYTHAMRYTLPIAPSPNLSTMQAVYLYPVLCLTEGTPLSCGRGTPYPFQVIGHPNFRDSSFSFTPVSIEGASKNPPFKNQQCFGSDLRSYPTHNLQQIPLHIFISAYHNYTGTAPFFTSFFIKLAGHTALKQQIAAGKTEEEIRASWQHDLTAYKKIRKKYLLYADCIE
ncbi:MAG: DUF1343 domain-containing protein [Bacteroidales bacterium]|jgi:uncharacterized protein YbbC (DUF1343 family)|nr:DUF1343 domain-containing protein [Bacteroidales bacterium]